MKSLLGKKWHRIPIALISALLVVCLFAGGAFAAVHITTPQTITQAIVLEFDEYGSITADDITLDRVKAGGDVDQSFLGAVTVVVGPDGYI